MLQFLFNLSFSPWNRAGETGPSLGAPRGPTDLPASANRVPPRSAPPPRCCRLCRLAEPWLSETASPGAAAPRVGASTSATASPTAANHHVEVGNAWLLNPAPRGRLRLLLLLLELLLRLLLRFLDLLLSLLLLSRLTWCGGGCGKTACVGDAVDVVALASVAAEGIAVPRRPARR